MPRSRQLLLIYPEVPETYWSYKHALAFVGKKALMPPLGLATIAAMIPDHFDIRIIDLNVERVSASELAGAELILVSAMIVQKESLKRLIGRCNAAGTPVVLGGPYATSCHEQISGVAHFVLGEAEQTFPQFLADYQAGGAQPVYQCERRPDIGRAPVPRFDLLQMHYYDTLPIQFSRGCPFNCEFCDIVHLFGHKSRTKDPRQFIAELDAAYATGFRGSLFIVDDNFIGNKRAVKELLVAVIGWQQEHGYPFNFSTEASLNLADDRELLSAMVTAGFGMAFLGIESPVAESLVGAGKQQNLRRDTRERVRAIQEAGIEVTGGFIIGFDSDPPSIFDQQIRFVQELAVPTAMVGLLMALPNTRLYDRLKREGRMLSDSNGNNTHDTLLNFIPRMPAAELEAGYNRVIRSIYTPRRYFARCIELLRRYPPLKRARGLAKRIEWREVQGFVRSLLRQTFSAYGPMYIRFMLRALRLRPDLIVRIVTMAIQGHHHFVMTREMMHRHRAAAHERARASRAPAARGRLPVVGAEVSFRAEPSMSSEGA
jgi:radical SAM superfamily enzyme YgiQ (UPF0313 family)